MFIHPLIVHFPIALLLIAYIALLFFHLWKREVLYILFKWNLAIGTIMAIPATIVGCVDSKVLELNEKARGALTLHENLGLATTLLFIVSMFWVLIRGQKQSKLERTAYLMFLSISILALMLTSHLGGELVYSDKILCNP